MAGKRDSIKETGAGRKRGDDQAFRKCFGYMDHMSRRHPFADQPHGDEFFDYPAAGEEEGRSGSFWVIETDKAERCSACPLFDRCVHFTEMSRRYSANPLNRLARIGADFLQRNRDSKFMRFFS